MKEIEIVIKYEKLYFDDIVYVYKTLKETTQKFFMNEMFWSEDKTYQFFIDRNLKIKKEDINKIIPELKEIVRKGITFEIVEWEKSSLKIKATIALSGHVLVYFSSVVFLPAGLTIELLSDLLLLIYSEHEEEYDIKIKKLLNRWKKASEKEDRKQRGISYYIIRIR